MLIESKLLQFIDISDDRTTIVEVADNFSRYRCSIGPVALGTNYDYC